MKRGQKAVTTTGNGRDKVTFALTGPKEGGPSIDDLIALFRQCGRPRVLQWALGEEQSPRAMC
jgi:hypothetical protein